MPYPFLTSDSVFINGMGTSNWKTSSGCNVMVRLSLIASLLGAGVVMVTVARDRDEMKSNMGLGVGTSEVLAHT